ncbi:hypothetical protein A3I18_00680 [Candidatus Campbellbacteria bacterium RIFCSPLOWO2_02_FULL_35_11]|uniref:Uncharacterized protein n=2 Tax=Candidatus Campbelliibacteriota TaxID=1752727 RepID=A0A1F5ENT4_9BACT|nr:MAG: hypothetical protein A3E89_01230 [Candidatus Campbellbacteria bacterium RIFCSPHIGHO2_12_FULL_35_10]OGD69898.1 MAG: hypothetical protein A3I18_00680 [Candidatus Campbellbacteria bacterium RIFCSPLOWO2_02_FULL_35_11]
MNIFINEKKEKCYNNKGYVALISVLVSGAVVSSIAMSVILLGIGSARNSFALEQSNQAKALANACAEQGLQQIRNLNSFTGSLNIVLGKGSCSYSVNNLGSENREILASGIVGTVTRKVRVTINTINPRINLASWEEVANF